MKYQQPQSQLQRNKPENALKAAHTKTENRCFTGAVRWTLGGGV